jgi:glycosyltransferase involved in cell wall biosynthesis
VDLSVVLPFRDQADHAARVLEGWRASLDRLGVGWEIVAVPNACRDETPAVVRSAAAGDARVRCIELAEPGWGRAVRAGLAAASGEVLSYANSARTDPAVFAPLLQRYRASAPCLVKVSRVARGAPLRSLGSALFNLEARWLFGLGSRDVNGTPKLFPREWWRGVADGVRESGDLLDLAVLAAATRSGLPVVEVERAGFARHGGRSSTGLASAARMLAGAIRLRWTS